MTNNIPEYPVKIERGEFTDESRAGRAVPYKIYYPADHDLQSMPVILWSHGFGGNRDGAGFIARHLAGQGYTLVHLTHHGTDSSLWEGKPGHPWDILRQVEIPREASLARFHDVPFALDQLEQWAKNNPEIGRYMDFDRIGMSGHSFGALTTQIMAGQLVPDQSESLISLHDPRFKAGILYSPVPIRHLTDAPDADVYGPIAMPLFHMTGTDDASPLEGFGYEHRLLVHDHAGHPDQYLMVLQGGDHMVYNGTRGKLEANPLREQHEAEILKASLAWWDAWLKDDETAKEWLEKYRQP